MQRLLVAAAGCLIALSVPSTARACSVCAGGDPLASASEQPSTSKQLRVALETEWLTVSSASESTPGANTVLNQYSVRTLAVYSPISDLNLVLGIPLVMKRLSEEGAAGGGHHGHDNALGVGDLDLGARWFAVHHTDYDAMLGHTLAVSAGTSLPTGPNSHAGETGEIDEHGQVGTGGFGPYAGVSYRLTGAEWSASASLTGRYRTGNSRGYRYGEALLWSAGADYRPVERFALSLGVDGRMAQRDRSAGEFVDDTGGLVLLAAPGVHFQVGQNFWLSVRAQLPFFTHLYGVQSVGPTVVAGLQVQIF